MALAAIAKAVKVGDGAEQGTVLGPIQNRRQYERVMDLLNDAKAKDLVLLQGVDIPEGEGFFVPVTIVDNPPEHERVVQEEAFGPILPMLKFSSIDEVVDRANASDYGLAGAVWSKNLDQAMEIARRMETGTVWINQNLNLRPDTPSPATSRAAWASRTAWRASWNSWSRRRFTSPEAKPELGIPAPGRFQRFAMSAMWELGRL
jgi:acyl-CoA reductase-like NAD-dependent aldehyde dehydrogenase